MATRDTFDIEDLSQLLRVSGEAAQLARPLPAPGEDMSIPIVVEAPVEEERDSSVSIVDTLTDEEREVFRFDQGRYLRYRVAVLGIGESVEEIYAGLRDRLAQTTDLLVGELDLWAKYQVALFGGKPKEGGVAQSDALLLADRLALFKANYLVLVNAGQVKTRFAEKNPQQLALLTHNINLGAYSGKQRPYTIVLVTDRPIGPESFALYGRLCKTMNTFPAEKQFLVGATDAVVEHARLVLRAYTDRYLKVQKGAR